VLMIKRIERSFYLARSARSLIGRFRFASQPLAGTSMTCLGVTASPSSPTVFTAGQITQNGDTIQIKLHQPLDSPSLLLLVWPAKPTVTAATPKALAAVTAAVVRTMAEAQVELAKIRNNR
jgi:hypothetical protein